PAQAITSAFTARLASLPAASVSNCCLKNSKTASGCRIQSTDLPATLISRFCRANFRYNRATSTLFRFLRKHGNGCSLAQQTSQECDGNAGQTQRNRQQQRHDNLKQAFFFQHLRPALAQQHVEQVV